MVPVVPRRKQHRYVTGHEGSGLVGSSDESTTWNPLEFRTHRLMGLAPTGGVTLPPSLKTILVCKRKAPLLVLVSLIMKYGMKT